MGMAVAFIGMIQPITLQKKEVCDSQHVICPVLFKCMMVSPWSFTLRRKSRRTKSLPMQRATVTHHRMRVRTYLLLCLNNEVAIHMPVGGG